MYELYEYNGLIYNCRAVDDARSLCPSGWHVPTDSEWTVMTDFLGGESVAGGKMKTAFGWHNGGNGTNSSGFLGLPGGYRDTKKSTMIGGLFLCLEEWRTKRSGGSEVRTGPARHQKYYVYI